MIAYNEALLYSLLHELIRLQLTLERIVTQHWILKIVVIKNVSYKVTYDEIIFFEIQPSK